MLLLLSKKKRGKERHPLLGVSEQTNTMARFWTGLTSTKTNRFHWSTHWTNVDQNKPFSLEHEVLPLGGPQDGGPIEFGEGSYERKLTRATAHLELVTR
jgi:hypothetical protein